MDALPMARLHLGNPIAGPPKRKRNTIGFNSVQSDDGVRGSEMAWSQEVRT